MSTTTMKRLAFSIGRMCIGQPGKCRVERKVDNPRTKDHSLCFKKRGRYMIEGLDHRGKECCSSQGASGCIQ